jgi:deazaflavin-dependent oxidoreductase (nitroreductase family)
MAEMSFTDSLIKEFRENGGIVTRPYDDSTLVLVHMRGARSGVERTLPLEYIEVDGTLYVFATKGGAPENPSWYYNLVANPEVTVEYLTETFPARAREVKGADRDRLWDELVRRKPRFGEYTEKTDRVIPVFALSR